MSDNVMTKDFTSPLIGANCQEKDADLLDPAEFCRLLLSRKHLIRDNRTGASAMALVDPVSGKRYQVDGDGFDQFIERAAG